VLHSTAEYIHQFPVLIQMKHHSHGLITHWIGRRSLRKLPGSPGNNIFRPCRDEFPSVPGNSSKTGHTCRCVPADRTAHKGLWFAYARSVICVSSGEPAPSRKATIKHYRPARRDTTSRKCCAKQQSGKEIAPRPVSQLLFDSSTSAFLDTFQSRVLVSILLCGS
jgi:hypothetical protein